MSMLHAGIIGERKPLQSRTRTLTSPQATLKSLLAFVHFSWLPHRRIILKCESGNLNITDEAIKLLNVVDGITNVSRSIKDSIPQTYRTFLLNPSSLRGSGK